MIMAYTIIEVERATGIPSRKIRFWADKGLFPFVETDKNGVRYFAKSDVAWVEWVCCLRNCNMSIEDIKRYIRLSSGGINTAKERKELLERQFVYLSEQIKILEFAHKKIESKIALYEDMIATGIDYLNPNSKAYQRPSKKPKIKQTRKNSKDDYRSL